MKNKLTGILIDPFKLTVEDFELDYNDEYGYKKIQEAINCKTFSVTRLDQTEVMFIDDEGRLKTHQRGFYLHTLLHSFGHFNAEMALADLLYHQLESEHQHTLRNKIRSKVSKNIFEHKMRNATGSYSNARFFVGKALILSDGGTGESYDTQYSAEKIKGDFAIYKLYVTDNDLEVGNIPYGISFVETNRAEGFSLHPHTTHIDAALV